MHWGWAAPRPSELRAGRGAARRPPGAGPPPHRRPKLHSEIAVGQQQQRPEQQQAPAAVLLECRHLIAPVEGRGCRRPEACGQGAAHGEASGGWGGKVTAGAAGCVTMNVCRPQAGAPHAHNRAPASAAASSTPSAVRGPMCAAVGGACAMLHPPGGGTPITAQLSERNSWKPAGESHAGEQGVQRQRGVHIGAESA